MLSRDLIEILLVSRPLLLGTRSLDDVNIGIQLIDVVDGVYDNRFFPRGGCESVIASRGEQDFMYQRQSLGTWARCLSQPHFQRRGEVC